MFPHTAPRGLGRLKKRREFLAVQRAQKKWAMPGMVVQARPRAKDEDPASPARIGFTASRKIGNAVERNRARRRLRACVAAFGPDAVASGYDIVLICRKATIDRPFDDLKADFSRSLKKLGALAPAKDVVKDALHA